MVCADVMSQLLHHGIGLSTASDTELIAHALCQQPSEEKESTSPDWVARFVSCCMKVVAACSLTEIVFLIQNAM